MDQFSRLHTFERPYFVCTSAKNNKLVGSFSYRMLKMPSYMAWKTTLQARDAAVCQAGLVDGVHCVHDALMPPRVGFRSHRAHRTRACVTPPIVPLLRQQWPLPPPTGPSVTLGLSFATHHRFSSVWQCSPLSCPVTLIALDRCSSSAMPGLFSAHRQRYSSPFPGGLSRTGPALSPALD